MRDIVRNASHGDFKIVVHRGVQRVELTFDGRIEISKEFGNAFGCQNVL